jgi:hypothetical protein
MTVNVYICVQLKTLYVYVSVVMFIMTAETDLRLLNDTLISRKYKNIVHVEVHATFILI